MVRVQIRDKKSNNVVKPRVFDAIIDGKDIYLEVKNTNNKTSQIIALIDVLKQIEAARIQQQLKDSTEQQSNKENISI